MDWNTWCKLCGSVDAILKPDREQVDVVRRLLEISIDDSLVCLECMTFLNTCLEFTNKSNQIQLMFTEVKGSNKDQINSIRMQYELPPLPTEIYEDNDQVQIIMKFEDSENIVHSITMINNESEDFIVEEHLEDDNEDSFEMTEDSNDREQSKEDINKLYKFNCHVCNEEFTKMKDLTLHCKTSHETLPQVECFCGKRLNSWKRLIDHRVRHFKEENQYNCFHCKLNYKTLPALQKHLENKHGENAVKWVCSTCGRSFKEKQILKNHEKVHLPDDQKLTFPCKICEKKFVSNHCLKIHIARVHEKVAYFFCEVCGKGCTTKSDLLWHMDKHIATRNFSCDICSLKFKSSNSLRIHKRRHEAVETTKQCPVCKKEFRTNSALSTHKLVHTEEKKYKCQYCTNSYKRLEALKCHLSIHTGQRPYKCPWCTRTFVNSANCRKHKLKDHPKEVEQFEAIHGKRGVSLAIKS